MASSHYSNINTESIPCTKCGGTAWISSYDTYFGPVCYELFCSKCSTHTPGPWQSEGASTRVYGRSIGQEKIDLLTREITVSGPVLICEASSVANAKLIAAAPELLALCKRLYSNRQSANSDEIKKVIDKAEGHSQND